MISIALSLLIIFLISGSFASIYLSQYWYVLNLFSHFQLQALVLLVVLTFLSIRFGSKLVAVIGLIYTFFLITLIFPATFTTAKVETVPEIFYQNVLIYNDQINEVANYVNEISPNIATFVELPDDLEQMMERRYKNKLSVQGTRGAKCGIFSDQDYPEVLYSDLEYPICAIQTPEYQLLVIHPAPPFGKEVFERQLRHFAEISEIMNDLDSKGEKFIVVGDFNSAIYPNYFRKYFGNYIQSNVYSWSPSKLWSIPIDHALANFDIKVNRGELNSSDHSSLLIKTKIK